MNRKQSVISTPGIGPTKDLTLRVSVAVLVRVLFENPRNGEWMLALERKATLHAAENGRVVEVKAQPFGGAIRILDLNAVQTLTGSFHFDTERSRSEQDFRILIRPSSWEVVRDFCIEHFKQVDDPIIETNPVRELTEEFADALKISLQKEQYLCRPVATVIENEAAPTENIGARGLPTVRVYRICEAIISDCALAYQIIDNSASLSDRHLRDIALADAQNGGKGRANAMLALPLIRLTDHYLSLPPEKRNAPIYFKKHRLDETVSAILDGINTPKYQKL
jgi:hypothetical protein